MRKAPSPPAPLPRGEGSKKELPPDWRWVKLGEVTNLNPKLPEAKIPKDESIVQFIPMKLVEEVSGRFHLTETRKYKEVKKGYTTFLDNDVLFAKVTPCMENGKIARVHGMLNGIGFGSTEFHVLRPTSAVDARYLTHFVIQDRFRNEAERAMTGAVGLRRVPKQFIENHEIPLPPLATQQAIVAKIEELFSELDKGIELIKLAQQQLKTYRQSVLKAAFEGTLGLDTRRSSSSPEGVSRRGATRPAGAETELPAGWKWVKLGDVAETILGKMLDKAKNKGQLQPYLRNINVRWGSFDTDDLLEMRFEADEAERYGVKKGDLIVCEGGEPGRCAVWTEENSTMKIQKALHRVRLNNGNSPYYLYYYFVFAARAHLLEKFFTGTTIKHFTGQSLRAFEFPLPPLAEQQAIVAAIESRLSVADQLEATLAQSLAQAEALRQSVLKQAFEGRLV